MYILKETETLKLKAKDVATHLSLSNSSPFCIKIPKFKIEKNRMQIKNLTEEENYVLGLNASWVIHVLTAVYCGRSRHEETPFCSRVIPEQPTGVSIIRTQNKMAEPNETVGEASSASFTENSSTMTSSNTNGQTENASQNEDRPKGPTPSAPGETKLYVGNLPDNCMKEDLKTLFCKYGEVSQCDRVKNFAFVVSFRLIYSLPTTAPEIYSVKLIFLLSL